MSEETSEEKATALRERIEAALRARDPEAFVLLGRVGPINALRTSTTAYMGRSSAVATGATDLEALAALAVAVGLNADGSDPRAENERLRAVLAVAQSSLAAAVRDERVTVVDEVARLTRERDAAVTDAEALRAAVREFVEAKAHHDSTVAAWQDADVEVVNVTGKGGNEAWAKAMRDARRVAEAQIPRFDARIAQAEIDAARERAARLRLFDVLNSDGTTEAP
jgi:hypothetical protein